MLHFWCQSFLVKESSSLCSLPATMCPGNQMDKNPLQGKGLGLTDQTELMETTYAAKIHVSNNTCTTWTQFFFFQLSLLVNLTVRAHCSRYTGINTRKQAIKVFNIQIGQSCRKTALGSFSSICRKKISFHSCAKTVSAETDMFHLVIVSFWPDNLIDLLQLFCSQLLFKIINFLL